MGDVSQRVLSVPLGAPCAEGQWVGLETCPSGFPLGAELPSALVAKSRPLLPSFLNPILAAGWAYWSSSTGIP